MNDSTIVFLTRDLFFMPMVRVASERVGCTFLFSPSLGNPRLEAVDPQKVVLCLLDLTITAADNLESLVREIRERFPHAKLAAFGPHVHENSLESARAAEVDYVVTRGQLNKNPEQCIRLWLEKSAGD